MTGQQHEHFYCAVLQASSRHKQKDIKKITDEIPVKLYKRISQKLFVYEWSTMKTFQKETELTISKMVRYLLSGSASSLWLHHVQKDSMEKSLRKRKV